MNRFALKFFRVSFSEHDGKSDWTVQRPGPVPGTGDQIFHYHPVNELAEATIQYENPQGQIQTLIISCPLSANPRGPHLLVGAFIHKDVIHVNGKKIIKDTLG